MHVLFPFCLILNLRSSKQTFLYAWGVPWRELPDHHEEGIFYPLHLWLWPGHVPLRLQHLHPGLWSQRDQEGVCQVKLYKILFLKLIFSYSRNNEKWKSPNLHASSISCRSKIYPSNLTTLDAVLRSRFGLDPASSFGSDSGTWLQE